MMTQRANTPLCRVKYPRIFSPRVETTQDKQTGQIVQTQKWSCQLVFDQSVQGELQHLMGLAVQEGQEAFGEHFWALVQQRSIRWPFRDGGEIDPKTGQPRLGAGLTFINVSSANPVEVVSKYCDPADPQRLPMKITDPGQLYSGEYVKANITFKAYKRTDSWGIGVYINGLQLWHEGDRWNDGFDAQNEFDAEGEMPAAQMPQQSPMGQPGTYPQPPGQPMMPPGQAPMPPQGGIPGQAPVAPQQPPGQPVGQPMMPPGVGPGGNRLL